MRVWITLGLALLMPALSCGEGTTDESISTATPPPVHGGAHAHAHGYTHA